MIAIACYNGRGIATGTILGREIARHIAGEMSLDDMSLPVSKVHDVPFRCVQEGFYELGAQIAYLPPMT